MSTDRIYLDHAATSFPKPPAVLDAVGRWFREQGVSANRGDSQRCAEVAARVADVRARLGKMCGVPAHRVVFTSGATESLNLFLDGFLDHGDRYLTTSLEHSSLARPLRHLGERRALEGEVIPTDPEGRIEPRRFAAEMDRTPPRLVAFSHASNVLGTVLDARSICTDARQRGIITLLDASPTAGLLDLDVGADVVVGSAHKSLLAPPGLGFLAVREGVPLRVTRFGGTGSSVALDTQPETWPSAMESGTPNTPAILGLGAALDFIDERGRDAILEAELGLIDQFRIELKGRATLHGTGDGPRIPVLSFNVQGFDAAEIGLLLDAAGIEVRTGFHCAPHLFENLPHTAGGTVRVSVGPFNSASDVRELTTALPGG
jgi:cysteine desulfurase / selenocysteine lyase